MKYAAYYRVSTIAQGKSGLGLEAQKAMVASYEPAAEFTEIESGRKSNRPELQAALAYCRENNATIVIARLDRLSRSVLLTSSLLASGVEFVCCDMPSATRFTLHLMAAMAEEEARMISQRTKDALQAAKRRGTQLGNPNLNRAKAAQTLRDRAAKHVEPYLTFMTELRSGGATLTEVATRINMAGHRTQRGNMWSAVGVMRVLNREAM